MKTAIDQYAVFGNPIAHSKSPLLHKAFAEQTNQSLSYSAQCVEPGHFTDSANDFFATGGKGLNVTVPFKEDAFAYAKQLTPRARCAEAVNTLLIDDAGIITGDNTDGVGLVTDMIDNLIWQIKGRSVLIVGAGGAVKGIMEPLIQQQPSSITIVNRTVEKAEAISTKFSQLYQIKTGSFTDLGHTPFDIIINGTSASLAGELPPLPAAIFHSDSCCYDMMYGKTLTPFLSWAQQSGCKHISDGLGMLVCQGAESFFMWRGVRPDTKTVIAELRKNL